MEWKNAKRSQREQPGSFSGDQTTYYSFEKKKNCSNKSVPHSLNHPQAVWPFFVFCPRDVQVHDARMHYPSLILLLVCFHWNVIQSSISKNLAQWNVFLSSKVMQIIWRQHNMIRSLKKLLWSSTTLLFQKNIYFIIYFCLYVCESYRKTAAHTVLCEFNR